MLCEFHELGRITNKLCTGKMKESIIILCHRKYHQQEILYQSYKQLTNHYLGDLVHRYP